VGSITLNFIIRIIMKVVYNEAIFFFENMLICQSFKISQSIVFLHSFIFWSKNHFSIIFLFISSTFEIEMIFFCKNSRFILKWCNLAPWSVTPQRIDCNPFHICQILYYHICKWFLLIQSNTTTYYSNYMRP